MRYDILIDILEKAGLGRAGETIFLDEMPADCKRGILIKTPLSGIRFDHYLPGYFKTRIQVIVRARTRADGNDYAQQVLKALWTQEVKDYTDPATGDFAMRTLQVLPDTQPISFPRSDGSGVEWSINFAFAYVLP